MLASMGGKFYTARYNSGSVVLVEQPRYGLAKTAYFALKKIVQDKNVPSAPDNYYTYVLESAILKNDFFSKILLSETMDEEGIVNLFKKLFLDVSCFMLMNEPPMVTRFADSGRLDIIIKCLNEHQYPLR